MVPWNNISPNLINTNKASQVVRLYLYSSSKFMLFVISLVILKQKLTRINYLSALVKNSLNT